MQFSDKPKGKKFETKSCLNFICPAALENTRCNQIRLVFFLGSRRQTQFNKAQQHDSWGQVVEAASQNSTEISLDVSLMTRWLPWLGGTGGLPIHGCTDSSQAGWVLVRFWDAKIGKLIQTPWGGSHDNWKLRFPVEDFYASWAMKCFGFQCVDAGLTNYHFEGEGWNSL